MFGTARLPLAPRPWPPPPFIHLAFGHLAGSNSIMKERRERRKSHCPEHDVFVIDWARHCRKRCHSELLARPIGKRECQWKCTVDVRKKRMKMELVNLWKKM